MTHKLIMKAKRKLDDADDSLIRTIKKRKLEIDRAVFSIPEEYSEDEATSKDNLE